MGEAIVAGLVQGALLDPETIEIAEPSKDRCAYLVERYGVACVQDVAHLSSAQTTLLAVKPQIFKEVARRLAASKAFSSTRVISIAAGITTATIAELFPSVQVIRVMPNTPLMSSAGMSVVAVGSNTQISEGELVVELFSLMGEALLLPEDKINAATALSGSGPAYFALFTEELARAGESLGLTKEQSEHMALQTLIGTVRQLQLTEESPEELRVAVTSPGGTTQAALECFASEGLGRVVKQAVEAACKRAEELA